MRHFLKYDLIPLLSMAAVCAFPCVFIYARNATEASASAMIPFLTVFSVNALAFFLLTLIFLRNASRAAFWTDLAMLVVINFCLLGENLRKILPFVRDRYLLAFFVLALGALFVLMLLKKPDLRTGCLLVLIAFGSMLVVNFAMALPDIVGAHQVRRTFSEQPDTPAGVEDLSQVDFTKDSRPNVYYFLFDEFGGYDNLMHYYDYDISPFFEELEEDGFTVSWDSLNTEAIHTDTIVPNLLNLQYVVSWEDSKELKTAFRGSSQLFQMFAHNGYMIDMVNHVDYIGSAGARVLTDRQTRWTISDYLMRNSIYYRSMKLRNVLNRFFVIDYGANYREGLDHAMAVGLSCWQEAIGNGAPTLTLGYLQFPHSPTMVGPNGEHLSFSNGWHWTDHSLYLGQVEYCSKYIRQLVEAIQTNDPDAMIILQSDHGNRYCLHMADIGEIESYDTETENPHMQNILNCVYYKGESFDIAGQTGINSLRRIFRQVFGADLPDIEPVYGADNSYEDEGGLAAPSPIRHAA